jgi:hypothetical protein
MKTITIVSVILLISVSGCKQDSSVSGKSETAMTVSYGSSGVGSIEGRMGYFSPALSESQANPYPSGYELGEYKWVSTDSSNASYRIFLDGDYASLKNQHVRATGYWQETIRAIGSDTYHYIMVTVDSIKVIP